MLPGGVEGAKAKAAESDDGFTSDSLSKDFEFWYKIDVKKPSLERTQSSKEFSKP